MKDIIAAAGCLCLGGFVVYEASGYPRRGGVEMHPGFYPETLGYILIALGVILAVKFFWKGGEKSAPSDIDKPRLAILVAALVAYSLVMEYLGYALSTFLFVAVAVFLFRGSPKTAALTGLASAVVLNVVFRYVFKAPLPGGIFL